MDEITRNIRDMYNKYPYPDTQPMLRMGGIVRQMLGCSNMAPQKGKKLKVLDAGCGRGVGLIPMAQLQPDIDFTGADISATALEFARRSAEERGLRNIDFKEVDLMTLDGLDIPDGGFDMICSSGVIHHMVDPVAGLKMLESVLAPHGVIVFMVYASYGREQLYRLVRAIDILIPRDRPLDDRLELGRKLSADSTGSALSAGPLGNHDSINDVEFVDRYLNVNETSYDIPGLWDLISKCGLKFLSWITPGEWNHRILFSDQDIVKAVDELPEVERYSLIEQVFWRHKYEMLLCKPDNQPRKMPNRHQIKDAVFELNPACRFRITHKMVGGMRLVEKVEAGFGDQLIPVQGLAGVAIAQISAVGGPFTGAPVIDFLKKQGAKEANALNVFESLLREGVIYIPHN